MGKKKAKGGSADDIKDLGNKAFQNGKFEEALGHYTEAIEMTSENPNHIYFANRAGCKIELKDFQGCIEDCDTAIKIEPTFIKSYIRKGRA